MGIKTPMGLGKKTSSDRFDSWSDTYESSFTWRYFFDPIHGLLADEIGPSAGLSVIDIGCGTGGLLRNLERSGASKLVGVDESPGMLDAARSNAGGESSTEFLQASAESLPLGDDEFDVALSCIAFHHFPDPAVALTEMRRVLKPGGRLLLCDMCGEGLPARIMLFYGRLIATDKEYYTRGSLSELVQQAGFRVSRVRIVNRFPPAMLLTAVKPPS